MAVSTPFAGVLSDKVRKKISTGATRKLFFLVGEGDMYSAFSNHPLYPLNAKAYSDMPTCLVYKRLYYFEKP